MTSENENEVEVVEKADSWCDNNVEYATGSVVNSLSTLVDGLTESYKVEPKKETIDSLLDVVDALTKTLAVHHKGREVRGRNLQVLAMGTPKNMIADGDDNE